MKKSFYYIWGILVIFALFNFTTNYNKKFTSQNVLIFSAKESPQQNFALSKLNKVIPLKYTDNPGEAEILIVTSEELSKKQNVLSFYKTIKSEGYAIKKISGGKILIIASDQTGAVTMHRRS